MMGIVGLLDEREGVSADAPLESKKMSEDPGLVLECDGVENTDGRYLHEREGEYMYDA